LVDAMNINFPRLLKRSEEIALSFFMGCYSVPFISVRERRHLR
jgi:hypothetical protein